MECLLAVQGPCARASSYSELLLIVILNQDHGTTHVLVGNEFTINQHSAGRAALLDMVYIGVPDSGCYGAVPVI